MFMFLLNRGATLIYAKLIVTAPDTIFGGISFIWFDRASLLLVRYSCMALNRFSESEPLLLKSGPTVTLLHGGHLYRAGTL